MFAAVPWCYFYFLCLFGFLTHICQYKELLCDCDKSESFIKLYSHVLSTTTYIFTFSLEFSSGYFCDYTLYCFLKCFMKVLLYPYYPTFNAPRVCCSIKHYFFKECFSCRNYIWSIHFFFITKFIFLHCHKIRLLA